MPDQQDQWFVSLFWKVTLILFDKAFVDYHFHQDVMYDHFNLDYNQKKKKKKAPRFSHMEALNNQRYHLIQKLDALLKKRNHLSMNALSNQRNHLRKIVLFHFILIQLMYVRKDLHFMWKTLHLQLYVFLILVAQEPWDLEKQLIHFADMLTHIPTVDSGMRFILQAQDFSSDLSTIKIY